MRTMCMRKLVPSKASSAPPSTGWMAMPWMVRMGVVAAHSALRKLEKSWVPSRGHRASAMAPKSRGVAWWTCQR